jgi:ABC-type branched-subunit amino acid transport system ATPase component
MLVGSIFANAARAVPDRVAVTPGEERRLQPEPLEQVQGDPRSRKLSLHKLAFGQEPTDQLARALVDGPSVVLLDEPTSGLSPREADTLGQAMVEVRAQTGCTFVVVEYDVPFIMDHCDRVVVLDVGQILAEGRPEEVRNNPAVVGAYLGEAS